MRKGGTFLSLQSALIGRARAVGLVADAPVAAVDATGMETRHVSAYFGLRRAGSGHRQRTWPKLTAVVDVGSHLIVGAVPGIGPSQDSPDFMPAMRQAAQLVSFTTALADAGYDAEHNHRFCREELGLHQSVIALNPRNTGERPRKSPCRHTLYQSFPTALYRQRWHVESAFSQHKRRFGSALTARRAAAPPRRRSATRTRLARPHPQTRPARKSRLRISAEQSGLYKLTFPRLGTPSNAHVA